MCLRVLQRICMNTMCMPTVRGNQRGQALDPLELWLWIALTYHVSAGN